VQGGLPLHGDVEMKPSLGRDGQAVANRMMVWLA
jgi:hypothetical protein